MSSLLLGVATYSNTVLSVHSFTIHHFSLSLSLCFCGLLLYTFRVLLLQTQLLCEIKDVHNTDILLGEFHPFGIICSPVHTTCILGSLALPNANFCSLVKLCLCLFPICRKPSLNCGEERLNVPTIKFVSEGGLMEGMTREDDGGWSLMKEGETGRPITYTTTAICPFDPFDDALFVSAFDRECSFEKLCFSLPLSPNLSTSASSRNTFALPTKSPHRYCHWWCKAYWLQAAHSHRSSSIMLEVTPPTCRWRPNRYGFHPTTTPSYYAFLVLLLSQTHTTATITIQPSDASLHHSNEERSLTVYFQHWSNMGTVLSGIRLITGLDFNSRWSQERDCVVKDLWFDGDGAFTRKKRKHCQVFVALCC